MVYSPFSIVAETIYLKRVFMFLTTNRKFGGWRVFIVPHVIKKMEIVSVSMSEPVIPFGKNSSLHKYPNASRGRVIVTQSPRSCFTPLKL